MVIRDKQSLSCKLFHLHSILCSTLKQSLLFGQKVATQMCFVTVIIKYHLVVGDSS